ncbi:hypothetical protein ACFU8W_34800 [Streptomyces sp. NPDC057565]|uniref:hypothetical protein n=1 Tax=Streptomyces sp. NPDC057565 TaxID=3346169 RepID=UPI0036850CA2
MIATLLHTLATTVGLGLQVIAVLTPIAALLATSALCSARVRGQFGCAGYLFTLALYALVPVVVRVAG